MPVDETAAYGQTRRGMETEKPRISSDDIDEVDQPVGTTPREWAKLFAVWVSCIMCSGLMPGQAVFASMYADAGVLASACVKDEGGKRDANATQSVEFPCDAQIAELNMYFGLGLAVSQFATIPSGLLFDLYGGRFVGAFGGLLVGIGLAAEAGAVYATTNDLWGMGEQLSSLVALAAIIADVGSSVNSMCFFGMIWHYPGSTSFILSLSGATMQISAALPLVIKGIMDLTGCGLEASMLGYSALTLLAIPVLLSFCPTKQDYHDRAKEVLGMPLPAPKVKLDLCSKVLAAGRAVLHDIRDHTYLCLGIAFSFGFAMCYQSMTPAYGHHLFGTREAGSKLAQMQAMSTVIVGAAFAPLVGKMNDVVGLHVFSWTLLSLFVVGVMLFWIPHWWAAWATIFALTAFSNLFMLFMNRYLIHYAPPHRLGTYAGVFNIGVMCALMPVMFSIYELIMSLPKDQRYFAPFLSFGIIGILAVSVFNIRLMFVHNGRGVPVLPHMPPQDEMELCQMFGAMNLDQAAEVTGMDKYALFKKMADPDPENIKRLMAMIDPEKLDEVMGRHSADDFILMLETSPELEEGDDQEDDCDRSATNKIFASESAASPLMSGFSPRGGQSDTCPKGHVLTRWIPVKGMQCFCDQCGRRGIQAPEELFGCRKCDYDICKLCFSAGKMAESQWKPQSEKVVQATVESPTLDIARSIREVFATPGPGVEARKAKLQGNEREPDDKLRWRGLAECLEMLVLEGDADGIKLFLLEVPCDDQEHCFIHSEENWDEKRTKQLEKKFSKLVPAKEFAALMRQNKGLKDVVARLTKRQLVRTAKAMRKRLR